jgi:tetratricopeptide (TPR) repeat protein
MIRRFLDFLGPQRTQLLFFLLAFTGLASLILNAIEGDWVRPAQSLLAGGFLVAAAVVILTRMEREDRARWVAILVPAIGAVILGVVFFPEYAFVFMGAALGWVVAGLLIFRSRARVEYRDAVRLLRKGEYADAVKVMDGVIKDDPNDVQHYRFRAEILRLWGKLDRARRDYQQMTTIDPQSAVGYNGLAEVNLQAGNYAAALEAGKHALQLAPTEWVAAYNLGMIEDRMGDSQAVITHLEQALALKVPERRHRLLIYLYLARAYARLGDAAKAAQMVERMHDESGSVREWQTILESDQAVTLRAVLGSDVAAVDDLLAGRRDVMTLAEGGAA